MAELIKDTKEEVLTFFKGFSTRNEDLISQYVDANKYVDHNPRSVKGLDGLKNYIMELSPNDNLEVIRLFQDGHYVVTQTSGQIADKNIFFDVFRFEDGYIVEHWIFSAPAGPPNQSGHTQTDGPREPRLTCDTEKNKAFMKTYYENFHIKGNHGSNNEYFTGNVMIRHEPGVRDGLDAFLSDVQELMKHRTIDRIKLLLGQGDFVFIAAEGTHNGNLCLYVDLYRVEEMKIVEHWGFPEMMSAVSQTKNDNRMH